MKLILQFAETGSVVVGEETVGQIGRGVVCLVGIHKDDTDEDLEWTVNKLLSFKCFDGDDGTPNQKTIRDINGEILLVSQFTLHARLGSGRRPDFSHSMGGEKARAEFQKFVDKVKEAYAPEKVQTGEFGAMMKVHIVNDGPITYTFDSFNKAQ
ncbi:D-tyrosyl-tRNA(Tyr) deacylase [Histomonas meleagridis]|uniref:D-tyrosyl-tRNA(Tyr) deacylase n=1 Tax=Histomonas meleagridis TaxID=135588 RepID=UPI00355AA3F5|nr:D-tyrosyl-tRNA(Tyr) deacylase [Histomonas meleagridis]KAH0800605.1 D-tyrosyl-tRNA(Tyr) deacylase [Histomonas meleagridis]